jgi:hypothetical protein
MTTLRPLIKWWLALAGAALLARGAANLPTTGVQPARPPSQVR